MKISLEYLESLALPAVFERGESYFKQGRVEQLIEIPDNRFEGACKGTQVYRQHIDLSGSEWKGACTCPYSGTGICKHLVAVGHAIFHQTAFLSTGNTSPLAGESFQIDPEWIRKSIGSVRPSDLGAHIAGYSTELNGLIKKNAIEDALRLLTGVYEGIQSHTMIDRQTGAQPFTDLKELFCRETREIAIPTATRKSCIDWIFRRWAKYESEYDGVALDAIRYQLPRFQLILITLAADMVSAHFTDMKLQAYGISPKSMPTLFTHLQLY